MIIRKRRNSSKQPHFDIQAYWRGSYWQLHIDDPGIGDAYLAPDDDFTEQLQAFLGRVGYDITEDHLTVHYPQA